jgi:hypothetical protein
MIERHDTGPVCPHGIPHEGACGCERFTAQGGEG